MVYLDLKYLSNSKSFSIHYLIITKLFININLFKESEKDLIQSTINISDENNYLFDTFEQISIDCPFQQWNQFTANSIIIGNGNGVLMHLLILRKSPNLGFYSNTKS